jgi:hypothetical protein
MRANAAALLAVTVGAGLAAALAGCSAPAPRPAAGQAAGLRPGDSSANQRAGGAAKPGSATSGKSRKGTAQAPTAVSPDPNASSHADGSSGNGGTLTLASGMYTDAPDGTPRYVFSLTPDAQGKISGALNYLYQDGRIAAIGQYSGALAAGGKLTVALADGKTLKGTYRAGSFVLSGCAAALPWAQNPGGCTFTYHGHVP